METVFLSPLRTANRRLFISSSRCVTAVRKYINELVAKATAHRRERQACIFAQATRPDELTEPGISLAVIATLKRLWKTLALTVSVYYSNVLFYQPEIICCRGYPSAFFATGLSRAETLAKSCSYPAARWIMNETG